MVQQHRSRISTPQFVQNPQPSHSATEENDVAGNLRDRHARSSIVAHRLAETSPDYTRLKTKSMLNGGFL
jgi:hypothetical protein